MPSPGRATDTDPKISCDVLVVGGGPAGSTCAWALRRAGLDVVVLDRAAFPRDKVCAGWITPPVVAQLQLDVEDYRKGRTFQPITGFRTGLVGERETVETRYTRVVSFGIRRCEFDHYLLMRSGARLMLGSPLVSIRRESQRWIVNDTIEAPMLVGAGGHFCPVARHLNDGDHLAAVAPLVVAREVEERLEPHDAAACPIDPEVPELYFSRDLKGYGWCLRKQDHINIGLGRLDSQSLPKATDDFVEYLEARGRIPRRSWRWRGHAYVVNDRVHRRVADAGVLLVGDAAGLAYPESGEGIRPAVESGLLAASTILGARAHYALEALEPYTTRLRAQPMAGKISNALSRLLPPAVRATLGPTLLRSPAFARHVVIDRWFLHAHEASRAS
jgi:geranylgeranyl reductase family protein